MEPYAIYAGDDMVGFVLYVRGSEMGIPAHHSHARPGEHFVLRFMIDARYQGQGYDRAGME